MSPASNLAAQGQQRRAAFWTEVNEHGPLHPLTAAQIAALEDVLTSVLEQDKPTQEPHTPRG